MSIATKSKLAVHGGEPVRGPDKSWPKWPIFGDAERRALNEVLESGKWWYGERVARFERDYAAFQDAQYCVTCTSGTTALELCLQVLGIGHGDEVIVPPYTFVATASAVARVGATPVFVDIDESWTLDPSQLEAAISPQTKAIIPVHFGGRIADMDRINAIAAEHELTVIEDACHSWGGKWKGKGTGALGYAGVFSFQASKNITAGEGGAILTDHEDFAEMCRSVANCGRVPDSPWYAHHHMGTNARLTEFAAALLSAQLSRLEEHTRIREENAAYLNEELSTIEGVIPQPNDPRITRRAYHLYCFRVNPEEFGCSRDQFVTAARAEGMTLGPGYPHPLYKQPVFERTSGTQDYSKCHCPVAEDLCYRSAVFFTHPMLLSSRDDMRDIVRIVQKVKEHASELAE